MGLESATYISQLVDTNPTGTDDKNQGDNHLRLIKDVLQNQFPNLGAAAVTSSAAEIDGSNMPTGMIMMWYGTSGNIPTGWVLCNGSNGTPNLTGKFVRGGTSSGATGGNDKIQLANTDNHTLTLAEMPAHSHGGGFVSGSGGGNYSSGSNIFGDADTDSEGGGADHNHGLTFDSNSNLPAYHTLVYIMKT